MGFLCFLCISVFTCFVFLILILSGINIFLQTLSMLITAALGLLAIIHYKNIIKAYYNIICTICIALLALFAYFMFLWPWPGPVKICLINPSIPPNISQINWAEPSVKSWLNSSLIETIRRSDNVSDLKYRVKGFIKIPLRYHIVENSLVIEPVIETDREYIQHKFDITPGLFNTSFNGEIHMRDTLPNMKLIIKVLSNGNVLAKQEVYFMGHN